MYKKLYVYKCEDKCEECKHNRQTFKEKVAEDKVCQKCKRNRVSEDQLSLFGDKRVETGNKILA